MEVNTEACMQALQNQRNAALNEAALIAGALEHEKQKSARLTQRIEELEAERAKSAELADPADMLA